MKMVEAIVKPSSQLSIDEIDRGFDVQQIPIE
jgi:hypothetical protein